MGMEEQHAAPPATEDDRAEKIGEVKRRPKWLVPVIAAGAAVVVVAAGVGGWHVWTVRELDAAKSACAAAADHTREAMNSYNLLLDGDAAQASKTVKDQVKDAKILDALADVVKAEAPEYAGCTADSVKGLKAAANTLDEQTAWYRTHEESLSKAVKAVNESKAAKTLDTARASLKAKLEEASRLLAESDGKVQDNAVRDVLSKAIDAGNKLVNGNDPSKLDKARNMLEDAIGKVNDSVKAKADADAKAAAEAEAAAEASAAAAGVGFPVFERRIPGLRVRQQQWVRRRHKLRRRTAAHRAKPSVHAFRQPIHRQR